MYPVIWVNAQSIVSIKDSKVIGHVSESIYGISSTVEINSCEIKGYGISIKDQLTLKGSKLKINYPFSYEINCVNSELEINEMEANIALFQGQTYSQVDKFDLFPALKRLNELNASGTTQMHIVTKAKSNAVVYEPSPETKKKGKRAPPVKKEKSSS